VEGVKGIIVDPKGNEENPLNVDWEDPKITKIKPLLLDT
jgi:hypothetical protein